MSIATPPRLLHTARNEDADEEHHLRGAKRVTFCRLTPGAGEWSAAGENRLLRKEAGSQSA